MSGDYLPHPKGMTSFWRSTLGNLDDHRTTDKLPEKTDVIIIGGGYTGGALLTHLLASEGARDKQFLVLEARQLCSGATGRNGGHLKPDLYNVCSEVSAEHGVEAAAEIADFELAHLDAIQNYVKETGADCDLVITRAVDVLLDKKQNDELKRRYDAWVAAGVDAVKHVSYFEGEQAELYSGVKGAKGAYTYTAGHLWPYKLVHHMFSRALSYHDNVNLQTHTTATSLTEDPKTPGQWIVETPRGTVHARQVIVATNAYTASILPEYKEKIIPYRTACCRIVAPDKTKQPFLPNSYVLKFNPYEFDYLIPRPDGSIIVGGAKRAYLRELDEWYGNVDDAKVNEKAKEYFDGYMQRTYRGWENSGAKTDQVWAGIMGYSADLQPRIGHVPGKKNVFICSGFTGHGMPQIFLAAKGLSKMVLEGAPFSKTGIPRLFEETEKRIASRQNLVREMQPPLAKL